MRQRIKTRLAGTRPPEDPGLVSMPGLSDELLRRIQRARGVGGLKPAAVLMPIVGEDTALSVLLTQRARDLPEHGGQISFPGGRIEPDDDGPIEAALRETEEEIGLGREFVSVAGVLDNYPTITGYSVTPVVGFVAPGFALKPDGIEVESVFEVPLEFLMDPKNHSRSTENLSGVEVSYFEINYKEYRIWGATAGMLISLYKKLAI